MNETNPLQLTSLDRDASLNGSLTQQPRAAEPLGEAIDFAALSAQREADRRAGKIKGYPETAGEKRLRDEAFAKQVQRSLEEQAKRQGEQARQQQSNASQAQQQASMPSGEQPLLQRNPLASGLSQQPPRTAPQPKPSTGAPAPTMQDTAARRSPLVDPTAPPRTVNLPQAVAAVGAGAIAAAKTLPKSLPIPAGLVQSNAIGGAVVFGAQVVMGRDVRDAALSAAGATAGSIIGGTAGSFLGPVGTTVGAIVGGMIGGQIAEGIIATTKPKSIEPVAGEFVPYEGGYNDGVRYRIDFIIFYKNANGVYRSYAIGWGPFSGHRIVQVKSGGTESNLEFLWKGQGNSPSASTFYNVVATQANGNPEMTNAFITGISRADGLPDLPPQGYTKPQMPADTRLPSSVAYPGDANIAPPRGTPAAGAKSAPNNYVPGSKPVGGTPRGDGDDWIPHGGLAPRRNPNPTTTPGNLGHNLPFAEPLDVPEAFWNPAAVDPTNPNLGDLLQNPLAENQARIPAASTNDGTSGAYIDMDAEGNLRIAGPAGLPQSKQQSVSPDGQKLVPPAFSTFSPSPVSSDPNIEDLKKDQDDLKKQITELGGLIAGLIPLLGAIPANVANDPTFQQKNKETVQGAICEISQPGGCLGEPIKKAEDSANNNGTKLDQINAALNGLDLAASAGMNAKLDVINNKLGDQLPGGLSGKLERLSKWLHLDRLLNLMIWATTIHNALMLSNDIGQTLLSAISNVLQLFGLKDSEGNAFDLSSIISSSIENIIKSIIGADNYVELKEAWQKASRIYQATINIFNQIQGLLSTVINALEITVGRIGKIGNALRASGEVLENAYSWMNPQPKFNRITNSLEALQNGASTIQMVTQAPLDVVNAVTETTNASTEFVKALKEDDKPENKGLEDKEPDQLKATQAASKLASAGLEMVEPDLEPDED